MKDVKVIGQTEQRVIDKARAYNNLVNETDFGDGKIKTVHDAIVQRLLCEAEELGLSIDQEPFASLGNRQFTYYRIPEDAHLIPWHNHVFNICQVEDKLQSLNAKSVAMALDGFDYQIDVDIEAGTRTYYLNGQHICDCTGTPALQDFKDLFSEERRRYYQQLEQTLQD